MYFDLRHRAQPGGQRIAIDIGHVDIHQDQVGGLRGDQLERRAGVTCFDEAVAFGLQDAPHQQPVIGAVFDAQDGGVFCQCQDGSWRTYVLILTLF